MEKDKIYPRKGTEPHETKPCYKESEKSHNEHKHDGK